MGNFCAKGCLEDFNYAQWEVLPEDVKVVILNLTTPKDLARLACVNRFFRDLALLDSVWQKMLPSCCADILAMAPEGTPTSGISRRQVFEYFTNRIVLGNGTQDFWLDRETGRVSRSIGAKEFSYVIRRRWDEIELPHEKFWDAHPGSRFAETAICKSGQSMDMKGDLKCIFSRGSYILSWRVSFERFRYSDGKGFLANFVRTHVHPINFSFKAADNEWVDLKFVFLGVKGGSGYKISWRGGLDVPAGNLVIRSDKPEIIELSDKNDWLEIAIGEFIVRRDDIPIDIHTSMTCAHGYNGLHVDSVVIRPAAILAKQHGEPRLRCAGRTYRLVKRKIIRNR